MALSRCLAQYGSHGWHFRLDDLDNSAVDAAEEPNHSWDGDGLLHHAFRERLVCVELDEVSASVAESADDAAPRVMGYDGSGDLSSGAAAYERAIFDASNWRDCGDGDLRWADVDFLLAWAGRGGKVIAFKAVLSKHSTVRHCGKHFDQRGAHRNAGS